MDPGIAREQAMMPSSCKINGYGDIFVTVARVLFLAMAWVMVTFSSGCSTVEPSNPSGGIGDTHWAWAPDFALEFFKAMRAATEAAGGLPPLGLHTLMKESTALKVKNMIENISTGLIAPVEIIASKP